MLPEPIAVTLRVTGVLEALGVPYFIGGSLASAIYGISRATLDVDLIADLRLDHHDPRIALISPIGTWDEQFLLFYL